MIYKHENIRNTLVAIVNVFTYSAENLQCESKAKWAHPKNLKGFARLSAPVRIGLTICQSLTGLQIPNNIIKEFTTPQVCFFKWKTFSCFN